MAPSSRPDGQLNLNLSSLPPIGEPHATKSPFTGPKATNSTFAGLTGARMGAGSPSHEQTSRLFPKRTRELQTPTNVSSNIWGPPTSGTSTPLFEIPESPSGDGFPDLIPLTDSGINSPARRGRAGTLPSRISPVGTINGVHLPNLTPKTSRPTPSTSPFRPSSTSAAENAFNGTSATSGNSALLSRLRAGSMPQRANILGPSSAVGQSAFSSAWNARSRAATLTSIQSAEDPTSPQPSGTAKDGMNDSDVRTLDYLGLAETNYPSDSDFLRPGDLETLQASASMSVALLNLNAKAANRFRSFSVNTQPKYPTDGQDRNNLGYPASGSGTLTPSAAAAIEAEYEAVQERVRLHNQAVQAFALNANAARPRARTAGLIETPQRLALRRYAQLPLESDDINNETSLLGFAGNNNSLADSFYDLQLSEQAPQFESQDEVGTQMSRSLWIGSIPNSTTVSSLDAIFAHYGEIESTRVLTHKNCGFVNFENVQDAVRARQILNGKEIFPGAGPVRIGFAKAPNTSTSLASGQNGDSQSHAQGVYQEGKTSSIDSAIVGETNLGSSLDKDNSISSNSSAALAELKPEILQTVTDFGAQSKDIQIISANIDSASSFFTVHREILPVPEPSSTRVYDAPKLRDIRKRIDNGTCGVQEVEQIAIDMLPEIAELSSDYLGNTVVQKLFEFCTESTKELMLSQIAPHLAEIGIHKNGTWAAQKIIEVCKSEAQMKIITTHLRPYTIPLFLDQYGNYVLQCCLKFGAPYNDFIFETMLSHLWEIAQGRFGARAMRACLESHYATKNQQRMLAAIIALHGVQLATNPNGALLLTWLLDTCTFPRRRSVLAPRLVPHLVQLCTHKVAYLTLLKIVNQRNEPEARETTVKALFFNQNDTVLEQILSDQTSGVTLIFKILTNPFLDDNTRPEVIQSVAKVLERIKAQPNQGYKRLMDEVGLSSRQNQSVQHQYNNYGGHQNHGQVKHGSQMNGTQYNNNNGSNNYMNGVNGQAYDGGLSSGRSTSADSFGFPSYNMNGFQNQTTNYANMSFQQMSPQPQYGFQPPVRNNNNYMSNNYTGYGASPQPVDAFRNVQNTASPLGFSAQMSPLMSGGGFNTAPYGQSNMNGNNYPYNTTSQQGPGYFFSPPMPTVHAGGRGRRR